MDERVPHSKTVRDYLAEIGAKSQHCTVIRTERLMTDTISYFKRVNVSKKKIKIL